MERRFGGAGAAGYGDAVGDLGEDTAVEPVSPVVDGVGRYRAQVRDDWEIWGPCGGYVASIALRAAGAQSSLARPVSFSCHYLGIARFDDVDVTVRTLRSGRTVESLGVTMTQAGRPILEAMVLATRGHEALEHDVTEAPDVPDPRSLRTVAERMAERGETTPYPFWEGIDSRPVRWQDDWPPPEPLEPTLQEWERFLPTATFDDPWVDACRSVMWIDVGGWPSAHGHHAWSAPPWVAVNVDLYVAFHQGRPASEFLLLDAHSPIAADGLVGYQCKVWSEDRSLVASGGGQLLCRPVPAVPGAIAPGHPGGEAVGG